MWYDKDVEKFEHRAVGSLRGCKGSVWEGGHRVPFIATWPDQIKAGVRNDHTIVFADVFATFAEIAGRKKVNGRAAEDSVSFRATLLHPDQNQQGRPPILHGGKTIRSGDWS